MYKVKKRSIEVGAGVEAAVLFPLVAVEEPVYFHYVGQLDRVEQGQIALVALAVHHQNTEPV